jgi:transcription antitermination factor NusA-like protein
VNEEAMAQWGLLLNKKNISVVETAPMNESYITKAISPY